MYNETVQIAHKPVECYVKGAHHSFRIYDMRSAEPEAGIKGRAK